MMKCFCVAAILSLSLGSAVWAQDKFPVRPITISVNAPAAGPGDTIIRALKDKMGEMLGQPIIVENREGGGGVIGTSAFARRDPDGYYLLVSGAGPIVYAPFLKTGIGYEPEKDLLPVNLVATLPTILVANPKVGAKSLPELLAIAKKDPNALSFSSAGVGEPSHLAAELLMREAGIELLHIPYPGSAQASTAVLANEASLGFTSPTNVLAHINNGSLLGLAVTGDQRLKAYPNVPTTAEAGMPGLKVLGWFGIFARAGTPEPVVQKINASIEFALASPEVRQTLERLGLNINGGGPQVFKTFIEDDVQRWGKLIRDAGIKLQ